MLTLSTRRYLSILALQGWDLCLFGLVILTVCHIEGISFAVFLPTSPWAAFQWILIATPAWHIALRATKLYASHRLSSRKREILHILKSATLATGIIATIALLLTLDFIGLRFLFLFWLIVTLLMIVSRILMHGFLHWLRRQGRNLRFVLIVGYGGRAKRLIKILRERSDLGYLVIGCVDNLKEISEIPEDSRPNIGLLGDLEEFPSILANNVVDEVFVTLSIKSGYESIEKVVAQSREQGIPVRLPLELFNERIGQLHIEMLDGTPILSLAPPAWNRQRYAAIKRVFDLISSFVLLLLLTPLFLVLAVLIKLDSPGPVFFVQQRVGLNKRLFRMYKFRTMVKNSERMQQDLEHLNEAEGPVFKISDDPRITRLGSFLRRTSLDELPQLFNVLKGEMSLVGPRPLPLRDVEGFTTDWQRRRFSVLPGITCFWQASGRSDVSFQQWMEMDMEYIDRASLQLDIKIILQTVSAVFRRHGAY